mmetsp:Transcript_2517/g.6785  ORF Transcript_2517/g.6785 Transcript_2517/m.6785 type:complete len:362 (-) Transcript_2517:808-1893(-)
MLHAMIVFVVDLAVVKLLLCVRCIDWICAGRFCHFGIGHKSCDLALQDGHPIFPHAFALHGLGSPKHRPRDGMPVGIRPFEEFSQQGLFASAAVVLHGFRVHHLAGGIEAHDQLGEFGIQEWHARLQSVGHRHSVGAMQIHISQHTVDAPKLVLDLSRCFGVLEVEIASKQLIGTFSSQDHLHILRRTFGKQPIGNGAADKLRLVGFHVIHDLGDQIEDLFWGECSDAMVDVLFATKGIHHPLRRHHIWRIFHSNRECLDGPIVAFLSVQWQQVVRDDARIDTTGQEEAVINIRHHTFLHRFRECFTDFIICDIIGRIGPWCVVVLSKPIGVVVTNEAFFRRPVVTGRNVHDGRRIHMTDK